MKRIQLVSVFLVMLLLSVFFVSRSARASELHYLTIDQNDSIIFDLSQAVCSAGSISFPVYFKSDDPIYAVDFSLQFNPGNLTFSSVTDLQGGLSTSAYFNTPDSTLRFTSYSITPMVSNTPLVSITFSLPSAMINLASFDSVFTLLNGDHCKWRFINPVLPISVSLTGSPVIYPGDSSAIFVNGMPGWNYLWSTGQTTSQIYVTQPGTYSIVVSSFQGCSSGAQITLYAPSPLPVELIHFSGKQEGDQVLLEWATASEINNHYFKVERQSENGFWNEQGVVSGSGTTSLLTQYRFIDENPHVGYNEYRLKQIDYDGTVSIMAMTRLKFEEKEKRSHVLVYPTVVGSGKHSTISLIIPAELNCKINGVYDIHGRNIAVKSELPIKISAGKYFSELIIDESILPGLYLISILADDERMSCRFIVN